MSTADSGVRVAVRSAVQFDQGPMAGSDIVRYIDSIARDKEIDKEALIVAIEQAMAIALAKKYGVEPDMAIFGKTLGNGYAITAAIGQKTMPSAPRTDHESWNNPRPASSTATRPRNAISIAATLSASRRPSPAPPAAASTTLP